MSRTLKVITWPEIAWVDVMTTTGSFVMGSDPEVDRWAQNDEQPQHEVVLDAYAIMKYEVTNAQYARCIEATVCKGKVEGTLADPEYADHPVVNVTWYDAQTFCEWVGGRLPTEAEWEYAARGPEGRIYPWGDAFDCAKGNFDDETAVTDEVGQEGCDGFSRTAPVGSFPEGVSWCGAYDMAGNVYEWVADWYGEGYYASAPTENPTGPATGEYRVIRGGSWVETLRDEVHSAVPRGAFRSGYEPFVTDNRVGLRCARSSQ
jgi:formylglycine-generating enzyme required for sulfatase activity